MSSSSLPNPKGTVDSSESWEKLAPELALERLDSNLERGLNEGEVTKRRAVYGANAVEEQRTNLAVLVLKKFWGPSAWMLEAILVLSVVLGKRMDAWVVGGLLALNATISVRERNTGLTVQKTKNACSL